jgi:hypothetical protein
MSTQALQKNYCKRCKLEKLLAEFYFNGTRGFAHECKECTKKRVRENRLKRIDYYREYDRGRNPLIHRRQQRDAYSISHVSQRRETNRRWSRKNKPKRDAEFAVAKALKSGLLQKLPCSICGNEKSESHHENYEKPLDVVWLCRQHHRARHVEIQNQQRKQNQHEHSASKTQS